MASPNAVTRTAAGDCEDRPTPLSPQIGCTRDCLHFQPTRQKRGKIQRSPLALLVALAAAVILNGVAGATHVSGDYPIPPDLERYLIGTAFVDTLAPGPLKYTPVASLDELAAHIQDMQMPVSLFVNAYDNLALAEHSYDSIESQAGTFDVFTVGYDIGGGRYTAYAYYAAAVAPDTEGAVLVIPGSGSNQSTAIYLSDSRNYHYDIGTWVKRHWDLYVYIKPNEDYLAVHRNGLKLSQDYIVNHALNLGGSYSVRYLIDTMAMVKQLQTSYDTVAVIGLSQGGQAALYNALQSEPDGAIVASGYSVIHERLLNAGLDQIIIPEHLTYYGNSEIRNELRESRTRFLFTYGKLETGAYRVEALAGCTQYFFKALGNVTCVAHSFGHEFPRTEVTDFLWSLTLPPVAPIIARSLSQNQPNPFVSATRIPFSVDKESRVSLRVFDAKGRLVRKLVDGSLGPDNYIEEWDGTSDDGVALPAGVYFYRLQLPDWAAAKKMTLVR